MTTPTARYRLGRTPNSGKPRVVLADEHVDLSTYTPPTTLDRYSAVPGTTWGMDGNDSVGDCTCADVDHEVKSDQVAAGNTEVESTADEVLAAYSAITGYNPDDPNSDQGAQMQDVRAYWQKTGFTLGGQPHTIALFAQVAHTNVNLVKWALDQLGAIGLGVNLPASAQDQFSAGQPWTVVEGSEIEGGHAIALVGYDAEYWYVVTWGQVQKVALDWFTRYVEEAWVVLTADFINSVSGDDALGGTLYMLGQQFAAVTGQLNPIPAPSPGPAPAPTPTPPTPEPAPVPDVHADAADEQLIPEVRRFLAEAHMGYHWLSRAMETWLAAKSGN